MSVTAESVTPTVEGGRGAGLARRMTGSGVALVAVYVAMLVFFSLASEFFLTTTNLFNVAAAVATLGIVAAAQTAVLISGGFDLSVGSVAAVASVAAAEVLARTGNAPAAIAAALGFGAFVGLINGLVITKLRVNPLIATLGMLSIVRGLGFVWTDARTVVFSSEHIAFMGRARLLGNNVPVSVLFMVAVFVAFWFILRFTVFGRFVYAVGGSERAAVLAGLPVASVRVVLYVLTGLCAGLAGLVIASQLIAGSPQAATNLELLSVTAAVLGGASLSGGEGRVEMTLIGVLIMGTLTNGLVLLDISSFWQMVATGVVLVVAVALDGLRRR